MVTRTFNVTNYTVVAFTDGHMETRNEKIGGAWDSNEKLLKKCRKMWETEDYKLCAVTINSVEDVLMGMTEDDFLKYATVLPPRKDYSKDSQE